MSAHTDVDVIIVGYGPVGQYLAYKLGHLGYDVVALERYPDVYGYPRAVHFDDEIARHRQQICRRRSELVLVRLPSRPPWPPPSPPRPPLLWRGRPSGRRRRRCGTSGSGRERRPPRVRAARAPATGRAPPSKSSASSSSSAVAGDRRTDGRELAARERMRAGLRRARGHAERPRAPRPPRPPVPITARSRASRAAARPAPVGNRPHLARSFFFFARATASPRPPGCRRRLAWWLATGS